VNWLKRCVVFARVIPLLLAVGGLASLLPAGPAGARAFIALPVQQFIGHLHIPDADLPPTPTGVTPTTMPTPVPPAAPASGKVIVVDLADQWLWAYQNDHLKASTPVTTGQPALATPTGTFSVRYTVTNTWFTSAWLPGSPWYYPPALVYYGLYFRDYGFFIHDATWRHQFGTGTNMPHTDANGEHETGSHGCIEVPLSAMAWLYHWAAVGTRIVIIPGTPPAPAQHPVAPPRHALPGKTGSRPA
jgi:hypothetical protein